MKLYKLLFEQEQIDNKEQLTKEQLQIHNANLLKGGLEDVMDLPPNFLFVDPINIFQYTITSVNEKIDYLLSLADFFGQGAKLPFTPDPTSSLPVDEQYYQAIEQGNLTIDDANTIFWETLSREILKFISFKSSPSKFDSFRNEVVYKKIVKKYSRKISLIKQKYQRTDAIFLKINNEQYKLSLSRLKVELETKEDYFFTYRILPDGSRDKLNDLQTRETLLKGYETPEDEEEIVNTILEIYTQPVFGVLDDLFRLRSINR